MVSLESFQEMPRNFPDGWIAKPPALISMGKGEHSIDIVSEPSSNLVNVGGT
jgi:hypothetical protein